MSWQTSSRSKSLSFWFLILLGILAVVAVGLVLYRYNREMGEGFLGMSKSNTPDSEETTIPLSEAMTEEVLMGWKRDEKNAVSVTGTVINIQTIPEQEEVSGTELDLIVSPVVDPELYPAPDKVYRFFLSKRDTEGFSETLKTGDNLTVTAQSAPMDDAYVIATKVEKGMMEKS